MPQRTSYSQGTPCWVDLQTTDPDGARSFYSDLFGWKYDDQPMGDGQVYSMALKDGGQVAAISGQSPEMLAAGTPPMWNTYLAVDDVDASTAKVAQAGGTVGMEPFDVFEAGRMSFVLDPAGAPVAFWQAVNHIGATVVNEHGTLIWNELTVPDPAGTARFYEQVLGVTAKTQDFGSGTEYTTLDVDGRSVAGADTPGMEGVPPHWHVYFGVDDVAASAAQVTVLGGTVLAGPMDTPVGPMATVRDPQGAVFSLFAAAGAQE
jgi:predicted enzyme related to lactoylglutathione lyase